MTNPPFPLAGTVAMLNLDMIGRMSADPRAEEKDKKDRLWLVSCLDDQRVDLNRLSKLLGAARFSFGKAELLQEVLGVSPGSVTPLAEKLRSNWY